MDQHGHEIGRYVFKGRAGNHQVESGETRKIDRSDIARNKMTVMAPILCAQSFDTLRRKVNADKACRRNAELRQAIEQPAVTRTDFQDVLDTIEIDEFPRGFEE
jgi:hypothetical protein